ncbi:unnamed protein product [Mytilus edulis]|uniref:CCHC-type domain-containing protein n=1 Tax=Mytilus edulis TaxID=6550 RepID=A0A8S3QWI9_MYTED|nr:unnamed protein product [Mytilus edulis]
MQTNPYYDDKHLKPSQNVFDSTDNVDNMAPTYAKVTNDNLTINTDTNGTNDTNGVKPIFIKETDVLKPETQPKKSGSAAYKYSNWQFISLNGERSREDNPMTDCQTGDRVFICEKQLPKTMQFGEYLATVSYIEQIDINTHFICSKCLQNGHNTSDCSNEWTCTAGCN